MLVIGLTGGIGSGKSTAAADFAALGVPVIDADDIARALVAPGQPALAEITARFGTELLDAGGALDRGKLRTRVFADPAERRALEALLHPRIRAEMQRRVAALSAPYCVLSIPLLVESGQTALVDRVLVIDAPPALQVERTMTRDRLSEPEVRAIMAAQATRSERLAAADDVIANDGDREGLRQAVARLHTRYLALAGEPGPEAGGRQSEQGGPP